MAGTGTDGVRWGILGPGWIAERFAAGLARTPGARLVALSGRDAARRDAFGARHAIAEDRRHARAEALAEDPGVDAIYVATPHPFHAGHALLALRAGKAVLVEKPLALNHAEATVLVEAARQEGAFLMEGYMYRSHPQVARLCALVRKGAIGEVRHLRATFGGARAFDPALRVFDRALGGGGILDLGGYPLSMVRLLAGVARGLPFAEPLTLRGTGLLAPSGVDEVALAVLTFPGGITAEIGCALTRRLENHVVVEGTGGTLTLTYAWTPGRDAGPADAAIRIDTPEGRREDWVREPRQLFAIEAEVASRAIAEGALEPPWPAMTHADSLGNAAALDRWRAEVGAPTFAEDPGAVRVLRGTLPRGLPPVPRIDLPGLDRPMSRLVIGCDNRDTPAEGALVWDAWMEAGGNAFDTAHVYGGGRHESVLGQWIASRGVETDVVVIAKGAHTPWCVPDAIGVQLAQSLDRLRLGRAPIYVMHRDNPEVPVGEFVDAIDALHREGRIGIWGGSNWTPERLVAAQDYARARGRLAPAILNNNLSLAVMERPVWPGCLASNDPATLALLRERQVVHLSWSSQARGYFLPEALRSRLPADTAPETCFGSPANAERRRRAEALAERRGVSAHNVALAWVLAQPFPSLALIGPRSPGEIASTLPALRVGLSPGEVDWLNLAAGDPG